MNHWKSNVIFNDLHPLIRLYFLKRFLPDLVTFVRKKIFSLKADNYLTLAYYNTYAMHKYWNKNYLFVYQTNPRRFGKIKNPIFVSSQPLSFMNKWQMFLQTISFWKTFLTHWALILLLPFMNGGNMCIYFGFFRKPWLTTIALVWLFAFMNRFKMLF